MFIWILASIVCVLVFVLGCKENMKSKKIAAQRNLDSLLFIYETLYERELKNVGIPSSVFTGVFSQEEFENLQLLKENSITWLFERNFKKLNIAFNKFHQQCIRKIEENEDKLGTEQTKEAIFRLNLIADSIIAEMEDACK